MRARRMGWIELAKAPKDPNFLKIDPSNYIVISHSGIVSYDQKSNKWSKPVELQWNEWISRGLQRKYPFHHRNMCYEPTSKQIFMIHLDMFWNHGWMIIFDDKGYERKYDIDNISRYTIPLFIDSVCHVIGGSNTHRIWNDETKTLQEIHTFDEAPWNQHFHYFFICCGT